MDIKPIKTETDFQDALKRLEMIFDALPNTAEGDELEVLGVLIDNYEKINSPIDMPDPIEAIHIRMEHLGIDRSALAEILATSSGRVSEIFNRRRKLTINMIRTLASALKLSERCLLQPYELATSRAAPAPRSRERGVLG